MYAHRLLLSLVSIIAATAAPAAAAERTPLLSWTFDDRLFSGDSPSIGVVVTGDKLSIHVDTLQRFGDSRVEPYTGEPIPYFRETANDVLHVPVGLRDFYFVANGNGFFLDDGGACPAVGTKVPKTATAVTCSRDPERSDDVVRWPRVPDPVTHKVAEVIRCTTERGLLLAPGSQRDVRLISVDGAGTFDCLHHWTLKAADDDAVRGVTLHVKSGAKRVDIAGTLDSGMWTAETTLDEAGTANASIELRYASGLTATKSLPSFLVKKKDDHFLVRIQPQLMASHNLRGINLGVAITPVAQRFFESGPWSGCPWLNGINPSAVVRFSGDNTTVLQFGFAVSIFANDSILFNTGLLFGSTESTSYWAWERNLFVGFAIDPALLLEARNTGK